jgi:hypothetical protein
VKIAGRLESWADGDLAAAGRVLLETHGVSLIKTVGLVALRGSLAYCGSAGPGIVDLETGERTAAPTIRWAVPVMWQGLPALLLDSRDTRVIEVLSRADLTSIGRLPAPPGRRRVGLNGLAYLPDLGICSVTRSGDDLTVESFAGAEGWTTTATWPIDPESSSWTVDGYVWVETASGKTEMYDLRGEPVWSPTETIIRFRPDGAPLFLVSESHRSLVLPEDEQLVAWPLPGGPPRWKVSIPRGAYHLVSHPDGDSFVYAAASGEIGRRRLDTGELISRTSLNKRFRGTRLSRGCGLSDEVLDVLDLSGAVIQP